MHKITPHLWLEKDVKTAADFYAAAFPDAKVTYANVLPDTPGGDTEIVSFKIAGQPFMAISGRPEFKLTPAISFFVNFDPSRDSEARAHLDELWKKLTDGGQILMPLDTYPFSAHYGWVQDRYGVSWQLMLTNPEGEERPFIVPSLMFTGAVAGRAEEAIDFYTSVFKDGKRGTTAKYPAGHEPDKEGTLMYGDFYALNTWLAAMDSAHPHGFTFTEALSLLIPCDTQEEMDYYSNALSAVPEAEQCGWLKDKFGVSWQVHATRMDEMITTGTPEQIARVTKAFLPMKRFNLAVLEEAFKG